MKKIVSSLAALAVMLMPFGAVSAFAADTAASQVAIKTVSAKAGDKDVAVPIEITANAGIVGMAVSFEYDAKALKLEKVEDSKLFADMSFTPSGKLDLQPFNILFENALATENYTNVGTLAILHFSVVEGAADGTYPITLTLDAENTFDVNMDNVSFNAVSGAIVIGNGTTTTAPAVTTTAPAVTTAAPATTTAAPATTTAAPATTTAAPATTTAAPATTTAAPATTTAAPATTTAAPVVTTSAAPATTTAAPVETTAAPVVTTSAAPATTTAAPVETTAAPVETTAAPVVTTAAPVVTTTAAPATTTAAPATTTAAPATTEAATTAAKSGYTLEQLADMAEKDYEDKHTGSDVSAAAVQNADGSVTITLTGKDGKTVSTYIVDAQTGKGKDEKGSSVDLPQTGVNGYGAFAAVAGAFAMVGAGAWLTVAVAKKKDEE